jgi:AraC-like DNA-binding protein
MTSPTPPADDRPGLPPRRLLLGASPALRRYRAARGYGGAYVPVWIEGEERLLEAARGEPPRSVVVVDALAADGAGPNPFVRRLIEAAPMVPVIAALPLHPQHVPAAWALLDWEVSELLDLEMEPTSRELAQRAAGAHARPFKRVLEAGLSRYVSGHALVLLRGAAEVVVDGGTRAELARLFGVRERTVASLCAREALPQPRRLLSWLRVLLALALVDQPGRGVRGAARAAGYADQSSLRRAAAALLDPGAPRTFSGALARFDAELRDDRERLREDRRRRRLEGGGSPLLL